MRNLADIIQALAKIPTIPFQGTLARIVPHRDLTGRLPPDFLFATGKPNRFNPAEIECVYFSEDEKTAQVEYRRLWAGLRGSAQPKTTFFAEVHLADDSGSGLRPDARGVGDQDE